MPSSPPVKHLASRSSAELSSTGIPGLDELLNGGLPAQRLYLIKGQPGSGKTTVAMQYLLEGARKGEAGLYIALSETTDEIMAVARSHGWSLDGISIFELSALETLLADDAKNTVFHSAEIELNQTMQLLFKEMERVKPQRLVIDSVTELRLLADSGRRFRQEMLALKQYLARVKVTVLLIDADRTGQTDAYIESMAHGVLRLEQLQSDYGAERRRVQISKLRGVKFRGGYHDADIVMGGLRVFPRLVAASEPPNFASGILKSGIEGLDALIGGGLSHGTATLFLGPAGGGKSTIAAKFACAAAANGEKVFACLFDENIHTLKARAASIGLPLEDGISSGRVELLQIDPAELAPGQFVDLVKHRVQAGGMRVVIIDSLNGYLQAMPDAKFLILQLHELLSFLGHNGIVTIMTMAQQGVVGEIASPIDLTYLADSVLLLRYFERDGDIRKAISVIKRRTGAHETVIREFLIDSNGIRVGAPLKDFQGVLTGVPTFSGSKEKMLPTG